MTSDNGSRVVVTGALARTYGERASIVVTGQHAVPRRNVLDPA